MKHTGINEPLMPVHEAKLIISKTVKAAIAYEALLQDCLNLVLASNVMSPLELPPFRQSAMDGYAFKFDDWNGSPLLLAGEMQAGATAEMVLKPGEAVRIFTGAPLPQRADTVVMQEKVTLEQDKIVIKDALLAKGSSVRPIGSEIEMGAVALPAGTVLTPAAIGLVASLGITKASVFKVDVAVIVTGKELQTPGKPLQFGQVYESNSYALTAALRQHHVNCITVYHADDDLGILSEIISKAIAGHNLVLLTGGVSVGDYDFVARALQQCGVEKLFHRLQQKPGKPLLFGKKDECIVFGLPGNPSSVLTCFYEYVLLALQLMLQQQPFVRTDYVPLKHPYEKQGELLHFLKGQLTNNGVTILDAQESYRLRSFAVANCLVVLPEEQNHFKAGELVEVHLLP